MATGKGRIRIAIEDFLETFQFGELLFGWVKIILEKLEDEALDLYDNVAKESGLEQYLPSFLKQGSINSRTVRRPVQIVPILLAIAMMVIGMLIGVFAPAQRMGMYKVDRIVKSSRPSPLETWHMAWRLGADKIKTDEILGDLGLDDTLISGYRALSHQKLSPIEYVQAWRRGLLTVEGLTDRLLQLGYERESIDNIISISQVIPQPNDLIFMAVKEAFNDDFIARYKTDEGLPPELVEWSAKQGLSEEWARRYWIAHWQLPSPSQVFEMLHRLRPGKSDNPILPDDVAAYLKAADYSPAWRDRLTEISYSPFTRVDVRRMFKTGVLDEGQVKEAYLDLGYNEERAQALTQFTIAYEAEEETGIVRGTVLSAYGDGMIDRSTAEGMLAGAGYDAVTLAFYLDNIDFKESLEIVSIKVQNIRKKYVEGLIDDNGANNEINMLNLPAERVTAMLELWKTERENQVALLSITQMETLLERGIVTEDDYKRIAKRRGYTDETITWTLLRIAQEAADKAQTAVEKAQADNERIVKSKTASTYQKDKSAIDLSISQARAEITDIDVAVKGDIDETQIIGLAERKDELKIFIAQMNVAKAQLRFDTQTTLNNL
jgi:hypothetical protein